VAADVTDAAFAAFAAYVLGIARNIWLIRRIVGPIVARKFRISQNLRDNWSTAPIQGVDSGTGDACGAVGAAGVLCRIVADWVGIQPGPYLDGILGQVLGTATADT
jgi:hypothetical protein